MISYYLNVTALRAFLIVSSALLCPQAELAQAQILEVLHSFSGPDGANPEGRLIQGSDGNVYGVTRNGGSYSDGTVFRMTEDGSLVSIVSFNSTNGSQPETGLVQGPDGYFYGTTTYGGPVIDGLTYGTIFKLGTITNPSTLLFFNGTNGAEPGGLVLGSDGSFYGTTQGGSRNTDGTLFRISPDGRFTNLPAFGAFDGYDPSGPLLRAPDGKLCGTTAWGGASDPNNPYGSGTIFDETTNGVYTMLAAFDGVSAGLPNGGLSLADDGNFYGTAVNPEPGAVFRCTPDGTLTTLFSFSGRDGDGPETGVIQARDHFLYGTTLFGGDYGDGNVFRISTKGQFQSLFSFNGTNGLSPSSGLLQASDGNLYGVTYSGGVSNLGTIFRISFPVLEIAHVDNGLVLSWPTNQAGFALQISDNLVAPNWVDCTNAVGVSDDGLSWTVTNSASSGGQFFRLKK